MVDYNSDEFRRSFLDTINQSSIDSPDYKSGFQPGYIKIEPTGGHEPHSWKFHLSTDPEDTARAWNIVKEELVNSGTGHTAKVAMPSKMDVFTDPNDIQAGKMITIYASDNQSPEVYQDMMRRIEQRFDSEGIRPGLTAHADRAIPGSKYGSYRLARNANGNYIASENINDVPDSQRYNPTNTEDPFKDMDFSDLDSGSNNARLNGQPASMEPLNLNQNNFSPMDVISDMSKWQSAAAGGQMITRLPIGDMPESQIAQIEQALKDQGMSPLRHESSSLGPTIRLAGADAYMFEKNRANMAAPNVDGANNARLATPGEQAYAQNALNDKGQLSVSADDIDIPQNSGAMKIAETINNFGKYGGVIGGTILGTVAGGITFAVTGSAETAATMAISSAVPMGETITNVATGADSEITAHTAKVEAASEIGSWGGAAAGAAAGALIGSAVPVIGTVAGGIVGGVIGAFGGGFGAAYAAEAVLTPDFNDAAQPQLARDAELALDPKDVRNILQQISPEQAEHLSPEMQSLYAFKDYEDKFHEQFTEIKNGGSLNYVQNEMPQVQNLVASNNPANNTPQELEYKQNGQQVTSPSMA